MYPNTSHVLTTALGLVHHILGLVPRPMCPNTSHVLTMALGLVSRIPMITFTGMKPAVFVKNGVYTMNTFTRMKSAAFIENGVYSMIKFLV